MLHLVDSGRTYDAETVAAMTAAFDTVCQSVRGTIDGDDDLRQKLALIILRHVDLGERDAVRLSRLASREMSVRNGQA